jgi:flagellar assembly protein FliH
MSTLYNPIADVATSVVEVFSYQDTGKPMPASPLTGLYSGGDGDERAASVDATPHTSQEEISRLVSAAHAEGLALGAQQSAARFAEEIAQERNRVVELVGEFQKQRADYYTKVELELVHLALAIAAKILHRESQIDRMVVAGLVKLMMERFQQNTKIVVRVRPEDADSWMHYFRDQPNVQILEDRSLEPKGCLLETELGVANMALDAQLKEVEQGFFDLLAQRPESK